MRLLPGLLLAALYAAQTTAACLLFEHFNSNIIIPYIVIVGLGTWFFGRPAGLLLIIFSYIPAFVLFQLYADEYAYPNDRLTGTLIMLTAVAIVDRLRSNTEGIRELQQQLEAMVTDREQELFWLTDELLNYSEKRRTETGQRLHDGIGQQLTGIQLLCSSLDENLTGPDTEESSAAAALAAKAARVHHQVRRIARALFPVRIAHVGLRAALDEMIACLADLHSKSITLTELRGCSNLPEALSLQLYRICQESCTYLLEQAKAETIRITLNTCGTAFILRIEHDGEPTEPGGLSIFNLIRYRIRNVQGEIRFTASPRTGLPVYSFCIPIPAGRLPL